MTTITASRRGPGAASGGLSPVPALRLVAGFICAVALLSAALPGFAQAPAGVPHVRNGAKPAGGIEDLHLEEMWRIGGDDDEDVLLGIVTRALLDAKGNLYLLDQQMSEVKVVSPEGELVRTIGRQGDGPGEVSNPGDFVLMPDGTLGMVQIFPGKIVKLNQDGTPAGDFNPDTGAATAGGFLALVNCRSAGGNLVLSGIRISMDQAAAKQTRIYFVRRYGMDGKQVAQYIGKDVTWDFSAGFKFREIDNDFIWWRMDVAPDGRLVVCEPRYDYALSVYSPEGKLEKVIDREYESWTRNAVVQQRYKSIMDAQLRQFPPGTEMEVETREQDVEDLRVARDGSIWVLPSRQMFEPEPGSFATYDVFTPDGKFAKQVRVHCPGDAASDRLIFAGDDRVIQVTGFWDAVLAAAGSGGDAEDTEATAMQVICYRMKKK
jgi:hypothetical protein